MKELSIEEKARRYDKAIEIAKEINNEQQAQPFNVMTRVFPELAESEDERIRKAIIDILDSYDVAHLKAAGLSSRIPEYIAWLKKQCEHANFCNKIQIGDKVTRNEDGVLVNLSQLNRVAKKDEKQGEQKPAKNIVEIWKDMRLEVYQQASGNRHEPNYSDDTTKMFSLSDIDEIIVKMSEQKPADKVEPKFRVGDWIVRDSDGFTTSIESIRDEIYYFHQGGNLFVEDVDKSYHLWTIQDAKDGDILAETYNEQGKPWIGIFKCFNDRCPVESFNSYCFITSGEHSFVTPSSCFYNRCVGHGCSHTRPATSDECKILFSKMSEAGYLWDTNKNELKSKNKPAWSELMTCNVLIP